MEPWKALDFLLSYQSSHPYICLKFSGWDISSLNLAEAMQRAAVLDWNLQEQLRPFMEKMKPRPSIYCPDFIAANQADRADNVLKGTKKEMVEQIRRDIRDFKKINSLDKVKVSPFSLTPQIWGGLNLGKFPCQTEGWLQQSQIMCS